MQEWKPLLEVLVQPSIAAILGGAFAFYVVKWIKARAAAAKPPIKLRVKVKVVAAVATSLVTAAAQEGLRVIAEDGGYKWQKVLAFALSTLLVATLGHLAITKPEETEARA